MGSPRGREPIKLGAIQRSKMTASPRFVHGNNLRKVDDRTLIKITVGLLKKDVTWSLG